MTEREKPERYRVIYFPRDIDIADAATGRTPKKYRTWEGQINALSEAGYKLKTVLENFAVMELEEPSKYENVDAVKKVRHEEAEAYLSNGWRLDSVYSNHVVLVRRRK